MHDGRIAKYFKMWVITFNSLFFLNNVHNSHMTLETKVGDEIGNEIWERNVMKTYVQKVSIFTSLQYHYICYIL